MPQAAALVREIWRYHRLSVFTSLAVIGYATFGLVTMAGMSGATVAGIEPLFDPRIVLVLTLAGLGVGIFMLGRVLMDATQDLRFERASAEEQDAMLARQLGLPIEKIRAFRRKRDDTGERPDDPS